MGAPDGGAQTGRKSFITYPRLCDSEALLIWGLSALVGFFTVSIRGQMMSADGFFRLCDRPREDEMIHRMACGSKDFHNHDDYAKSTGSGQKNNVGLKQSNG